MALTRDFKVTAQERLQRDPAFREALLAEARLPSVQRRGDRQIAAAQLRQCRYRIRRTRRTDKPPKSLMRMRGSTGNPRARKLFEIIDCLRQREGVRLKVQAIR